VIQVATLGATPSGHDFLEMWLRKSVHAGFEQLKVDSANQRHPLLTSSNSSQQKIEENGTINQWNKEQ
jgi:hypothetical protein